MVVVWIGMMSEVVELRKKDNVRADEK